MRNLWIVVLFFWSLGLASCSQEKVVYVEKTPGGTYRTLAEDPQVKPAPPPPIEVRVPRSYGTSLGCSFVEWSVQIRGVCGFEDARGTIRFVRLPKSEWADLSRLRVVRTSPAQAQSR